jgi:hypothetical protein
MKRPSGLAALAALAALAVALVAAFIVAPRTLAGGGFADERSISEAFSAAFVEYWGSGGRAFSPDLERVVDYWLRYHVAKAAIAAILLAVLVMLGVLAWQSFLRTGRLRAASAGTLLSVLALFSLMIVMANVQGAIAPFASLLPMLPEQSRQQLAGSLTSGGRASPALEVIIGDFARYHVALAVVAAIVAIGFVGLSGLAWKRFAGSSDRRARRLLGVAGVFTVLVALGVAVVAVANWTTAADPEPALLAFFHGGW